MVSTRSHSDPSSNNKAAGKSSIKPASQSAQRSAIRKKPDSNAIKEDDEGLAGSKREVDESKQDENVKEEPPTKKAKTSNPHDASQEHPSKHDFQIGECTIQVVSTLCDAHQVVTGTIERGHIYFFYRPKVELDEAHSVDDIQRFHMLLVPRPPGFSVHTGDTDKTGEGMELLSEGADAVPAPETTDEVRKAFRLIPIGKKSLPDPNAGGGGQGGGRKQIFWANINTVGSDLKRLEDGLGEKTYETKTKG